MNIESNDPILNVLTGVTPYPAAHSEVGQINSNDQLMTASQPSTLKELLAGHKQQAEILALMSEKHNESALLQVEDKPNELS